MAAPVIVGGVGTALSLEDVLEVAAGERKIMGGKRVQEERVKAGGEIALSIDGALSRRLSSLDLLQTHLFFVYFPPQKPSGAPVSLDTAVLERIKKESPSPAAFKPEDAETAKAADDSATATGAAADAASSPSSSSSSLFLTETEARSAVLARLLSLANGSTRVRPAVLLFLAEGLLNCRVTPRLPTTRSSSNESDDAAPLAAVAAAASSGAGATLLLEPSSSSETTVGRALAACSSPAGPPGLSAEERAADLPS